MQKKVVIIDDEEDLCHLMKAYLKDLNYEVYYAYSLSAGLELLKHVVPDVLFIDNNLPDGLGSEQMSFLKSTYPNCRINLISANYSANDHDMNSSGVTVIEKPLRLNAIKDYL
jgi:two-component system, OmpR family, response regulator